MAKTTQKMSPELRAHLVDHAELLLNSKLITRSDFEAAQLALAGGANSAPIATEEPEEAPN